MVIGTDLPRRKVSLRLSRSLVLLSLSLSLIPGACLYRKPWTDDALTARPPADLPPLPPGPALRVLILGDFGTGDAGQREVARAIADTHASDPPDLVLTVGDNFYPRGVSGVDDPRWISGFEEIYQGEFWDALEFFPALGNHDVQGNAEAQIAYSARNPRWNMPGRYYTFRRALPSGDTARFLALDTNGIEEAGPAAAGQLAWVDSVLGANADPWVVAYGHHPMVTGGWHDSSQKVREALAPRFQGRVSFFLAGHNHSTELLRMPEGILQGVCGGGAGRDNAYRVDRTPLTLFAFSNGGWCLLHLWPTAMVIEGYNRVGTIRFRHLVPLHEGPLLP